MVTRICPVIRRMPRRNPAPPPLSLRGLRARLLTFLLALAVMSALWLIDTGELLLLALSVVLAYFWQATAFVGFAGLLAVVIARLKPSKPSRRSCVKPRTRRPVSRKKIDPH